MRSLTNIVVYKYWLVLGSIFILFSLAANTIYDFNSQRIRITVEPSIDQLLPNNDPSKQYYDLVKQQFGNDEIMIIAIEADDIFTHERLTAINTLTDEIQKVAGVEKVVSLSNLTNTYIKNNKIKAALALSNIPEEKDKLEILRHRILDNTLFNGNIISNDAKISSLLVSFGTLSDADMLNNKVIDQIKSVVNKTVNNVTIHYTGNPFIKAETTKIILHDLIWLPLIVIVVIAFVLAISFKTIHGVLVPLITSFTGVIFTLSIITSMGYSLNIVTAMTPALLMTLGLAYTVHSVSDFHTRCSNNKEESIYEITYKSLCTLTPPLLLAGLTTSIGFLSLVFNNMIAIKEFGIFSVIGVLIIVLLSVSLTPALLAAMGKPKPKTGKTNDLNKIITLFAQFDYKNRKYIFITAFIIFLISISQLPNIRSGTEYIGNFKQDSYVAESFNKVNTSLSGANIFSIIIDTNNGSSFTNPENLKEVEELQTWLNNKHDIGSTLSIVDYIKFTNQKLHKNQESFIAIPESENEIINILNFNKEQHIYNVINKENNSIRIIVRAKVIDSDKLSRLINQIEERLTYIPNHLDSGVTGNSVLLNKTINMIVEGQLISISISLLIVYLILSALFLSFRIGLIALIPNLLPITVYYSSLAIFDITLNPATSLIGPMILGIAVDDTIHYFTHFNRDAKKFADDRKATITSLSAVGKPITYTSIGLCLGFLTFLLSDLKMQNQVGIMAAFTLAIAWLTDFILTPALCSKVRLATLWDVLTLDLGKDPHKSIPLLYGLKPSYAKIFALTCSIKEIPSGVRLFTEGDKGNEMYIIIDGKLQSFLISESGRVNLSEHSRGDVVGEIGLYHDLRSANVEVVENARLLRVTQKSLTRLKKSYPRIAAQVFSNLNDVLASRLVKASHRIQ